MKHTLLILGLLFCLSSIASAGKQGYCKSFEVRTSDPNEIEIFTVPIGERFVLLTTCVSGSGNWSLTANSNFSISGRISENLYSVHSCDTYQFPDMTATINAAETLFLAYDTSNQRLTVTLIGYFEDLHHYSTADLTGDGIVNFADFAVFANEWLTEV